MFQLFQFPYCHLLITSAILPDNEVYAWGNNSMGQCGQGNSTGPITKPKKVVGLDGVAIQQISAGTSHSLAWTALPRDRSANPQTPTPTHTRMHVDAPLLE